MAFSICWEKAFVYVPNSTVTGRYRISVEAQLGARAHLGETLIGKCVPRMVRIPGTALPSQNSWVSRSLSTNLVDDLGLSAEPASV